MLEDLGFTVFAAATSQEDGTIEMLAGDPAQAEIELRKGYDALAEMGEVGFRCTIAAQLANAVCAQGRWDEASQFAEFVEVTAAVDDVTAQIEWRGARAKILAHSGAFEEAERLAREAVDMAAGTEYLSSHGDAVFDLGGVLGSSHKIDDAVRVFRDALRLFEQKGNVVSAGRARASLERLAGERL
jgi:tetratricopeptide (TPR) repeat protein